MSVGATAPAIGIVGIPDGWSTQRLTEAVERRCGACTLVDCRHMTLDLARGELVHDGHNLARLDAIIVKKIGRDYRPELFDRLEMLHFLERRSVRVFSKPASMMRLLDRLSCTVTLRAAEIPMPDTVITEDIGVACDVVRRFGRAVFKPLYTSKARGMMVIEDNRDTRDRITAFRDDGNSVLYIQQMVAMPDVDLGVVFLGGEYLATYARASRKLNENPHEHTKTRYWAREPSPEIIELARRAQAPFDLDFTCVDVVETDNGPLVFEVSAFGGFRGLQEANGIDAAARYVDYVLGRIAS